MEFDLYKDSLGKDKEGNNVYLKDSSEIKSKRRRSRSGSKSKVSNDAKNSEQIKVCQIKSDTKRFEIIDKNQVAELLQSATEKYPIDKK